MECPACSHPLFIKEVDNIDVDICKGGCGGLWFDNHEFRKFDEPHESAGEELLDVAVDPEVVVDYEARRNCPKCDGFVMMRRFCSIKRHVEIDECAGCGGIWLDAGELRQIRSQYKTEEERKAAARAYFDEVFGDQLAAMRRESEEGKQKARRIANAFRFICPSYYIPGDQDWGAF